MKIFGVDFSGARADQHTWLALGDFDGETLTLQECRRVTRAELTITLANAPGPAVAALDFPFSVPQSFARFWKPDASTMPHLWAAATAINLEDFMTLRNQFVSEQGEPKRLADSYHPECYSCLHLANPNMVPMTFHGMQMLHQLWQTDCSVPPLIDPAKRGTLLLEAMPGAALKAFGLPYKGYKNGLRALDLRQRILGGLSQASGVAIRGLDLLHDQAVVNHDCLDAIVAAVVAALWHRRPGLFRLPAADGEPGYNPVVLLEGWLYAPVFIQGQSDG